MHNGLMIYDYILIAVAVLASIAGVLLTVLDKKAAINKKRRVPEIWFFVASIPFGALATYITMLIIRHKTRHLSFMFGMPVLIIMHIIVLVYYILYTRPMLIVSL